VLPHTGPLQKDHPIFLSVINYSPSCCYKLLQSKRHYPYLMISCNLDQLNSKESKENIKVCLGQSVLEYCQTTEYKLIP